MGYRTLLPGDPIPEPPRPRRRDRDQSRAAPRVVRERGVPTADDVTEVTGRTLPRGRGVSGIDEAGNWTPAFPRQREPFRQGNGAAVTHGAYSDALVRPLVDEVLAIVGRVDAASRAIVDAQIRCDLVLRHVDIVGGIRTPEGRAATKALVRFARQAQAANAKVRTRDRIPGEVLSSAIRQVLAAHMMHTRDPDKGK